MTSVLDPRITDLLKRCRLEFKEIPDIGDSKRKLVKCLQELSSQKFDQLHIDHQHEIEGFIRSIWEYHVLLEDCILVSGLIFAKLNPTSGYYELLEKAQIENFKNADWIRMSLLRGIILTPLSKVSQLQLEHFGNVTMSAIDEGISKNRIVLICRHLENLLHIFNVEQAWNCYNLNACGHQIIHIINRTLRLKADLTDYKSRDLVKWHLNILQNQGSPDDCADFTSNVLDCLPEMNKISIQIYDSLCSIKPQNNHSIQDRIFDMTLPCLAIKGGLGTAAAQCITKLLALEDSSKSLLLSKLLESIFGYPSSRDIVKVLKMILESSGDNVKMNILKRIDECPPSLMNRLLVTIIKNDTEPSVLEPLLASGDEFIALEAFSILTRDSLKYRRKPVNPVALTDLILFQKFIESVQFSGSVDFRQKVSVAAKSFHDQIFARIYHLIREISKKPREVVDTDPPVDTVAVVVDREALALELNELFSWLNNFIKSSLVEPLDFCRSNFGSVEFAFTQIIGILSTFDGNVTLVAANSQIISSISQKFQSSIIESALLPFTDKFIHCIGKSTYDNIRLQAIDILCKCKLDAKNVLLDPYLPDLAHPRAINNEGAARIVLLHSRLSRESRVNSILQELSVCFEKLKSDFPVSLRANNINGRLLLLRFLLQERPEIDSKIIQDVINMAVEVSTFVSTIASHPSPEGLNISTLNPENDDEDINGDADGDEEEGDGFDESVELKDSEPISNQYILSFSWRAVKETSSLIETLLKIFSSKISKEQYTFIAEHFKCLLLKLRHCGAFTAIQAPLSTTLRLGYTFSEKSQFLKDALDVCLGTGQIATTRRSAGLPFLVLALAHSFSASSDELSQLLAQLFPPLLANAKPQIVSESLSPSVIHAFNIIRSLVRDSRIASEMGLHMASIAELCLESFNSPHWNVRNASAMLLSSLISRIFGPKHVNDLSARDHQVDLREIEVKFDGLVKVLIDAFLKFESFDFEPRIAYPLLAVLERIRIPPHERFNDFRGSVIAFISKLLEKLELHPESGRKLAHVLGRTLYSLLNSKSIAIDTVRNQILMGAVKNTPNSIYNLLVLLENVQAYSDVDFFDLLPPCNQNWHQILVSKYKQVSSHKSLIDTNFPVQIESPVLSLQDLLKHGYKLLCPDANCSFFISLIHVDVLTPLFSSTIILNELNKTLPNIQSICKVLKGTQIDFELIHKIIQRFKFNEEILKLALPNLCKEARDPLDERLKELLTFYASAENNENLRFIVLESIKELTPVLLKDLAQCIFTLLLDDDEEIRNEICIVLNPTNPLNLIQTLESFVVTSGKSEFIRFLNNYESAHAPKESKKIALFEKESLNLFIDPQFLRKKFTPQ